MPAMVLFLEKYAWEIRYLEGYSRWDVAYPGHRYVGSGYRGGVVGNLYVSPEFARIYGGVPYLM